VRRDDGVSPGGGWRSGVCVGGFRGRAWRLLQRRAGRVRQRLPLAYATVITAAWRSCASAACTAVIAAAWRSCAGRRGAGCRALGRKDVFPLVDLIMRGVASNTVLVLI
jgi:hypothetical protein